MKTVYMLMSVPYYNNNVDIVCVYSSKEEAEQEATMMKESIDDTFYYVKEVMFKGELK